MKKAAALLLALCSTTSVNAAMVVSVGDGDMIRVSERNQATHCAPRVHRRIGDISATRGGRSRELLNPLTPIGSELTLRVQTTDRYGRTVA